MTANANDRTLLLVDDEAAMLSALKRELHGMEYILLSAASGEEALRILAESDVQVILSDYRMPGMTGVEFLSQARRLYPDAVRMVLSGYADIEAVIDAINFGHIYKFINKPWDTEQLREAVHDAFEQHDLARRGAQFFRIFENTREGILITDKEGNIQSVNPALSAITGYPAVQVVGLRFDFLYADQPGQVSVREIIETLRRTANWTGEIWSQRNNGEVFPASVNITAICDANNEITQFVGLLTDITERKQREIALLESEKRFRDFMEFAAIGMVIIALDGRLLKVNQALCRMLGYNHEELESMNFEDFTPTEDLANDLMMRRKLLEGELSQWQAEKRYLRRDGGFLWVQLTASVLRDTHGAAQYFDVQVEDISERRQHQEQIRQLAYYDTLTGLANRRLLQERLEQVLHKAQRDATLAATLFLDLDHFKQVNDVHGHEAGDALLKATAQRLTRCVRRGDTVARQGGDEFIVVLAEVSDIPAAERVAVKIVQALALPYELTALNLTITTITTSVGIAIFPTHGANVQELLKQADLAMYAAKESGRNGYRLYDSGMAV
ncbi:MAG: PAS domain S-box protein [Betaproteobacteria bacterium]|nr:PAS domain S-box protein [Betaproteobacteria bacterium]